MRNAVTGGIIAGMQKEANTVGVGVTRNIVSVTQSVHPKGDAIKNAELGGERKDERKEFE